MQRRPAERYRFFRCDWTLRYRDALYATNQRESFVAAVCLQACRASKIMLRLLSPREDVEVVLEVVLEVLVKVWTVDFWAVF